MKKYFIWKSPFKIVTKKSLQKYFKISTVSLNPLPLIEQLYE